MTYPITANCQCGQSGYHLHKAPLKVFACHCTECQKLATSPYSVTAIIAAKDVDFFGEMSDWSRSSDSGNTNCAKFCSNCGNRIYHFNPAEKDMVKLKLKPVHMQDDTIFAPEAHIWTCEQLSWLELSGNIPSFDKMP